MTCTCIEATMASVKNTQKDKKVKKKKVSDDAKQKKKSEVALTLCVAEPRRPLSHSF